MHTVRATVVWCVSQLLGSSLERDGGRGEETGRETGRQGETQRESAHARTVEEMDSGGQNK